MIVVKFIVFTIVVATYTVISEWGYISSCMISVTSRVHPWHSMIRYCIIKMDTTTAATTNPNTYNNFFNISHIPNYVSS